MRSLLVVRGYYIISRCDTQTLFSTTTCDCQMYSSNTYMYYSIIAPSKNGRKPPNFEPDPSDVFYAVVDVFDGLASAVLHRADSLLLLFNRWFSRHAHHGLVAARERPAGALSPRRRRCARTTQSIQKAATCHGMIVQGRGGVSELWITVVRDSKIHLVVSR